MPHPSTISLTNSVNNIRIELNNDNSINRLSNGVSLSSASSGRSLNATNRMLAAICCVFLLLEVFFLNNLARTIKNIVKYKYIY